MTAELELDPTKEIINPRFAIGDGVAICAKWTNYGANNMEDTAIMMKSKTQEQIHELRKQFRHVRVTLSFEEFLGKFLGMWSYDAKVLAILLGYEVEYDDWEDEQYREKIKESVSQVELLKSNLTEEDFFKFNPKDQDALIALQVKFEKALNSGTFSGIKTGDTPNDKTNSENGENIVTEQDTKYDELLAKMAKLEALADAQKARADAAEAKALDSQKDSLLAKSADMAFVSEDSKAMLKSMSVENIVSVMDILHKAQEAVAEKASKITELEEELKKAKDGDVMTSAMSGAGEAKDDESDKSLQKSAYESSLDEQLRKFNAAN